MSRLTTRTVLTTWLVAEMYNNLGSLGCGAAKIGLVARSVLISSRAALASGVHFEASGLLK